MRYFLVCSIGDMNFPKRTVESLASKVENACTSRCQELIVARTAPIHCLHALQELRQSCGSPVR